MSSLGQRRDEPLKTVWCDLKASIQIAELPPAFERYCTITRSNGLDDRHICPVDTDLVVLEFDYPSKVDMEGAAQLKSNYPSVPMIIITVQHSEALAVWFFRKKFIDYLVQPVINGEATHCLTEVSRISQLRRTQDKREFREQQSSMPMEVSVASTPARRLQPAINLVSHQYYDQLTVSRAAEVCQLQPFRFGREFKEEFGIDFREYVVRYRIREACRLLRNPQAQIADVAYAVGFSEPSYFTKTFKRLVGAPPSQVVGRQDLHFSIFEDDEYRNSTFSY
jgi:AraC-like DNA-binding protein